MSEQIDFNSIRFTGPPVDYAFAIATAPGSLYLCWSISAETLHLYQLKTKSNQNQLLVLLKIETQDGNITEVEHPLAQWMGSTHIELPTQNCIIRCHLGFQVPEKNQFLGMIQAPPVIMGQNEHQTREGQWEPLVPAYLTGEIDPMTVPHLKSQELNDAPMHLDSTFAESPSLDTSATILKHTPDSSAVAIDEAPKIEETPPATAEIIDATVLSEVELDIADSIPVNEPKSVATTHSAKELPVEKIEAPAIVAEKNKEEQEEDEHEASEFSQNYPSLVSLENTHSMIIDSSDLELAPASASSLEIPNMLNDSEQPEPLSESASANPPDDSPEYSLDAHQQLTQIHSADLTVREARHTDFADDSNEKEIESEEINDDTESVAIALSQDLLALVGLAPTAPKIKPKPPTASNAPVSETAVEEKEEDEDAADTDPSIDLDSDSGTSILSNSSDIKLASKILDVSTNETQSRPEHQPKSNPKKKKKRKKKSKSPANQERNHPKKTSKQSTKKKKPSPKNTSKRSE